MKKLKLFAYALILSGIISSSCTEDKDESTTAPVLPPYESLAFNFASFTGGNSDTISESSSKSSTANTYVNFSYSVLNVAAWNILLTVTLAVPVASFAAAVNQEPEYIGNATWQWNYSVQVGLNTYSAKLLGKVQNDKVKWEMYVTKTGALPFEDFLWFEGNSTFDGMSGQWILYYSPTYDEEFLQIDWVRTGDGIGEIKYTTIRELNDNRTPNLNRWSYIQAGYTAADYDGYYNIHVYDSKTTLDFIDINILWNTAEYYGKVKSTNFYGDEIYHCWDNTGADTFCE